MTHTDASYVVSGHFDTSCGANNKIVRIRESSDVYVKYMMMMVPVCDDDNGAGLDDHGPCGLAKSVIGRLVPTPPVGRF